MSFFSSTQQEIEARDRRYRLRFVLVSVFFSFCLTAAYMIAQTIEGRTDLLLQETIVLAVLSTIALLMLVHRNEKTWIPLVLGLNFFGLASALFDPVSNGIEIEIFLTTGPLALLLLPPRKALLPVGAFFLLAMGCLAAAKTGLAPDWTLKYPPTMLPVILFTFLLLLVFSAAASLQYQNNLAAVIAVNSFYPVSGLPRRHLLLEALDNPQWRLLVLVRCVNQFDLVLVHSGGFNETLVTDVSAHLRKYGEDHSALVFQLKDNEYALLFSTAGVQPAEVEASLQRLHDSLEALQFSGSELSLQVSLGAVPLKGLNRVNALAFADQALKTAERSLAPVVIFNGDDRSLETTADRLRRFTSLRRHMEKKTVEVFFQPIFDTRALTPIWYEALLRIPGSEGKLESVFPYLSTAESTGLMPRLTLLVIEQAVAFIRDCDIPVSLNLSLDDIQDKRVKEALLEHSLALGRGSLVLEFLERAELQTTPFLSAFIQEMKAGGCRIALDDFGAGYSNFSCLVDFPFDLVKIDGGLVKKSLHDPKAMMLVTALIQFCRESGVKVVAEHIDSPVLLETFRELGVDYLQGFYLGKPEPAPLMVVS